MPPRREFAVPTNAPYPHTHRLSNNHVARSLSKLSRNSLISLALEWLSPENASLCKPILADDAVEDDDAPPYLAAESLEDLKEVYEELGNRKGGKKEVVDRILEGDWRHGLTLYQLAMAEARHLQDHPASLRWTALRITQISAGADVDSDKENTTHIFPRVHGQTILSKLEKELAPLAKVHYYLSRLEKANATLLRLLFHDSPYNTQKSLQTIHGTKSGFSELKSIYLLFPEGTPFVYVSMTSGTGQDSGLDDRSLRAVVLDAVASALSKRSARYTLKSTGLAAKSIDTLLSLRGPGRTNRSQGGWSIFVDNNQADAPIDYRNEPSRRALRKASNNVQTKVTPSIGAGIKRPAETTEEKSQESLSSSEKRRRLIASNRFGILGIENDGTAMERLDVRIADRYPQIPETPSTLNANRGRSAGRALPPALSQDSNADRLAGEWKPSVRITFHGTHVFAGIRALVEQGKIDGERMPGWMTGEASVSIGIVKDGRIVQQALD